MRPMRKWDYFKFKINNNQNNIYHQNHHRCQVQPYDQHSVLYIVYFIPIETKNFDVKFYSINSECKIKCNPQRQ